MAESLWDRDTAAMRSLAQFLDKYLYKESIFENVQRTDGKDEQKNGSDIVLSIPSKGIKDAIVDEKGQLSKNYINHPLPTFVLELSFKNNENKIRDGWFVNENERTTHHIFLWINKASNPECPSAEDFQEVEFALVNRQKLVDYFSSEGLTIEKLKEKAVYIREHNIYRVSDVKPMYKFFFSNDLKEQPINIVVKKRLYMQFADIKGIITQKKVTYYD